MVSDVCYLFLWTQCMYTENRGVEKTINGNTRTQPAMSW